MESTLERVFITTQSGASPFSQGKKDWSDQHQYGKTPILTEKYSQNIALIHHTDWIGTTVETC